MLLQEYEIRHTPGSNIINIYVIDGEKYDTSKAPLPENLIPKLGLINKIKYAQFRLNMRKIIGDYGHGYIEIHPYNKFYAFKKDGTPVTIEN